jgi:hypothetical protein
MVHIRATKFDIQPGMVVKELLYCTLKLKHLEGEFIQFSSVIAKINAEKDNSVIV